MDFLKEVKSREDELVTRIQELVRIDSVLVENSDDVSAPFGEGIKKSLEYVLSLASQMGFKTKNVGNVAGHIEYGEGEEIVGVLCHVDVVPADGVWKYDPFSGTIEDGKIYGRGTIDDKGPTICALFALKILKDLNIKLKRRVRLIIGTDEETAWRGINEYLKVEEHPSLGFSPDADFPLIYGEKGILTLDLVAKNNDSLLKEFTSGKRYNVVPDEATAIYSKDLSKEFEAYLLKNSFKGESKESTLKVYGKSAHAMIPNEGINAAILLAKFLVNYSSNNMLKFISEKLDNCFLEKMGLNFYDEEMKELTMNLGVVRIKDEARVGLNFRYPINLDIDKFILDFKKQASSYDVAVEVKGNNRPHYISKESKFIKILHNAYIEYTNDLDTPIKTIGGGTYARAIPNAVAFGILFPHEEELAHQANENISIDSAVKATAILAKAISDLANTDSF